VTQNSINKKKEKVRVSFGALKKGCISVGMR